MENSQIRGLILLVCSLLNLVLTFIVWSKAKGNRGAFHLGFLSLFSAIYAFVFGFFFYFDWQRLIFYKLTFLGVLIIPAYLAFVYISTGNTKHFRLRVGIWYAIAAVIILFSLFTPYLIAEVGSEYPYFTDHTQGPLNPYTRIYIIAGLVFSWFYLLRDYFRTDLAEKKKQLKYFIFGISVYSFAGVLTAGILPLFFPKFFLMDLAAIFSFIWAGSAVYAILKDNLFDIKVLLTEILVYIFGTILFFQMFFSSLSQQIIFQLSIFFVFCFIGYLLVKVSRRDSQKNEILEQKVQERTKNLQASNQALEQSKKLAEDRAAELEKWYSLTVGRELRMAELKGQIKELEEKNSSK